MFVVLLFSKLLSIKYVRLNKPSLFDSKYSLYALSEKKWRFWLDLPPPPCPLSLPLSLTHIRTLSMEPTLKMSTILFVLVHISYKGGIKSQINDATKSIDYVFGETFPLLLLLTCIFLNYSVCSVLYKI